MNKVYSHRSKIIIFMELHRMQIKTNNYNEMKDQVKFHRRYICRKLMPGPRLV